MGDLDQQHVSIHKFVNALVSHSLTKASVVGGKDASLGAHDDAFPVFDSTISVLFQTCLPRLLKRCNILQQNRLLLD